MNKNEIMLKTMWNENENENENGKCIRKELNTGHEDQKGAQKTKMENAKPRIELWHKRFKEALHKTNEIKKTNAMLGNRTEERKVVSMLQAKRNV